MSLSGDQDDDKKNYVKRQSVDSPLAAMSPSVRPQPTKLFRLSKTPLGPTNINQVDPNIDATLLEPYSVEGILQKDRIPAVINYSNPNIEQSLMGQTLQSEETVQETLAERSIESECDDVANVTAVTSSSVDAALSPGMSKDMKLAIKAYLKSTSMYSTNSLEPKVEQLNTVDNVAKVEKSEDIEELNNSVSTCDSQERAVENTSKYSVKVALSVPSPEFFPRMSEIDSCCGIPCKTIETNDASFAEVRGSPILKVENAEAVSSITPKYPVGERLKSPDMQKDLTLSARKNRVFASRNLKLDNLSSPRELANYAEERAQNYSFLINEAYCETSMFCENCYSMRVELGLFSDKFAALAATIESHAAEGNITFVAELENLLRGKQAEIVTLSSKLRDLTQANDQLSKQKEIAEKDMEDYKFFFENEMKKKSKEMGLLRSKLYETENLIDELKQARPKQSSDEDTSKAEGCQMEIRIKIMEQQLDMAHSLHHKAEQRIKELESELQRVAEEKNQFSLKIQESLIDLENKNNPIISDESKHVSIISLLEAKVAELGNKVDEALREKENESVEQKSYLIEKLTSLVEKIKTDVKNNVFAGEWEADDIEISVTYFEKAVDIICQDVPQFETLVEIVALHEKLARNEFKQLEATIEEVVKEKKKWEILFTNEKSRFDGLQEMILTQFCENKNCFSNLLQDFQSKWADTLYSMTELARSKSEENRNCAMLEMLHHIADLQEKLNKKWLMDSSELQKYNAYLKEQHLIVASFQTEMQEMRNKIEMLHGSIEKDFKNSSALLDSFQGGEAKHKSLRDSIKKQLGHYKKERDIFKEICEHSEDVIQELRMTVEHLQKVEEDMRSQNAVLCKKLDFGSESFADMTENLTKGKDKLEDENATLRNMVSRLTKENTNLKEMEKMLTEQNKKAEELQHRLNLLQKENERLGKACDDADEEVSDLKQQIFELLRINARLQAEMHGESEEAVNRRMGYIEPPAIRPTIHPSAHKITLGMNSPNGKVTDVTKTKSDVKIENVLLEKAEVKERNEIQRLAEKENVLSEDANASAKKIPAKELSKSKVIRDQSCRTS
ncbi:unnamed protein product [Acanthocheilonema viteae]|uniref:Uncharacterized protein n=1 Tax=Acanthocheilonema viteae TaxID=6277 RepID=A0A498SD72_ACAVI|nr:unnamed protein product [Acanthocheilonema viteae]